MKCSAVQCSTVQCSDKTSAVWCELDQVGDILEQWEHRVVVLVPGDLCNDHRFLYKLGINMVLVKVGRVPGAGIPYMGSGIGDL